MTPLMPRGAVTFGRGIGHGTRGIETLDVVLHRPGDVATLRRGLHGELLVGDAPDGDARVIPVAPDELVPLAQVQRIAAEQPVLVHDQHAEAVAGIEQLRGGRVVRGANGVAAEFLQLLEAECLQRVRNRGADAGVVLVIAGAVDLIVFAVEQKAEVRVEGHGADAENGFLAVDNLASHRDGGDELVELRRFRRPENRRSDLAIPASPRRSSRREPWSTP